MRVVAKEYFRVTSLRREKLNVKSLGRVYSISPHNSLIPAGLIQRENIRHQIVAHIHCVPRIAISNFKMIQITASPGQGGPATHYPI